LPKHPDRQPILRSYPERKAKSRIGKWVKKDWVYRTPGEGIGIDFYFKDRFLGIGTSEIRSESGEVVGLLDMQGLGRSAVDVYGPDERLRCKGKATFFMRGWRIMDPDKEERGLLTLEAAFLKKKFRYETKEHGVYLLEAEAFTRDFEITHEGEVVASVIKTNGFWSGADAYVLHNESKVDSYEWAAVIIGIQALLQD